MAIPATVKCPCCGAQRLTIYQDSRTYDAWHHCGSCGISGDIIELAAKAWKLDIPATVRRLAANGVCFPDGVDDLIVQHYLQYYIDHRQRVRQLLRSGRGFLRGEDRGAYEYLMRELNIMPDMELQRWEEHLTGWISGAPAAEIDMHLRPTFADPKNKGLSVGRNATFCGGKWRQVLLLPFEDMPGRIRNLLMIGRRAEFPNDYVFRPLIHYDGVRAEAMLQREAGVFMYSAATKSEDHPEFGNWLVVCEDPMLALRLQSKHLRTYTIPLPLVASYNREIQGPDRKSLRVVSYDVWHSLGHRRLVFWGERLTPAMVNMAARAEGYISICTAPQPQHYRPALEWIRKVRNEAVRWDSYLDRWLRSASTIEAKTLLADLDLPLDQFQSFHRRCHSETQQRIRQFEEDPDRIKSVSLGKRRVTESPRGWIDATNGGMVCSASLRIHRMLYQARTDELYYQGNIRFEGEDYPFVERQSTVDKGTFRWMRTYLIANGGGVMSFDINWQRHAIDIAILLHNPVVERDVGSFGWQIERNAIVLPRIRLPLGRDPIEYDSCVLDDISPCTNVTLDEMRPPSVGPLTTDSPAHPLFWAAAAAIGANIIAPAVNRKPVGIGLLGDGAVVLGCMTARLWGCAEAPVDIGSEVQPLSLAGKLHDLTSRHSWPLLLQVPGGKRRRLLTSWLHSSDVQNVIFDVDSYLADALRTQTTWRFLSSDTPITAAPAVADHGQHVLFCWLADTMRRGLGMPPTDMSLALWVLEDMAAWAGKRGGDPDTVLAGAALLDELDDDTNKAASLLSLICRCIDDGSLVFAREGFDHPRGKPTIYRLDASDHPAGVFLPRAAINKTFAERGVPAPDPQQLTDVLAEAGGLECIHRYEGMLGWLLNDAWWQRAVAECQARQQRMLRIVG